MMTIGDRINELLNTQVSDILFVLALLAGVWFIVFLIKATIDEIYNKKLIAKHQADIAAAAEATTKWQSQLPKEWGPRWKEDDL